MVLLLAGVARGDRVAAAPETGRRVTGTWGGDHVAMEATETGARLEFDCAHGSIGGPIATDAQGRFRVEGTIVREHPGPVLRGEQPRPEPVTYSGTVDGDRMTLRIVPAGSEEAMGEHALVRGAAGRVRKCR